MPRTIARRPRTNTAASRRFAVAVAASRVDVCEAILSGRRFGVEIEFVGLDRSEAIRIISSIPGVRCNSNDDYSHQNSATHWKVTTDSSVVALPNQNYNHCGEVVSPILSGQAGLEQVHKVVKALANAGATANRSCGLHVHVDTAGLTAAQFFNIVARYTHHESTIDAFMPVSRRANNNQYCMSSASDLRHARPGSFHSLSDVARDLSERYRKVNVTSYNRHHTVEFRQHSGSVNADKVCNWIQFCVNFVNTSAALAGPLAARRAVHRAGRVANGTRISKTNLKMQAICNAIENAPGGYGRTVEELRTACINEVSSTSAASVVVMISNLRRQYGWVIRKRGNNYRVISPGRSPVAASTNLTNCEPVASSVRVSTADTGAMMNLPAHIVAFYQERQQELAAS